MRCVYIANTPSQTVVYHDMIYTVRSVVASVTALADVSVDVWTNCEVYRRR